MRTVFLDTVGLIALWDEDDQWHTAASVALSELGRSPYRFVTTNLVMFECGNAASRTSYRREVVRLRNELASYDNLLTPTEDDERLAWEAYLRGEAAQAGIIDHISFVVMRRLGLTEAFTNDRHFLAAGLAVLF